MDISEKTIESMRKQRFAQDSKELVRLRKLIDNDLDENGNTILDKFPYLVELESPIISEKYKGFLDWLDGNINKDEFRREWVSKVYFKNEVDAVAFKLRWL